MYGRWGYPVATEVGLPGGRADLVVFNKETRDPETVVDIKTSSSGDPLGQILVYAAWFQARPVLLMTLGASTPVLRQRAGHVNVQVIEVEPSSLIQAADADRGDDVDWIYMDWQYRDKPTYRTVWEREAA